MAWKRARSTCEVATKPSPPGSRTLPDSAFAPDLSRWDAWTPQEVRRKLEGVDAPWYIAAGWAIDLFLGGSHRQHEDVEIAVPRAGRDEVLAALTGFELFWVGEPPGTATPLSQAEPAGCHQIWVREPLTGSWRLDVFSEPSEGDLWICRRDPAIRMPYEQLIERTAEGIPYGRPEVMLLFKAKPDRPKDDEDLAAVLPRLGPDRRRWLAEALETVHPRHRWLRLIQQQ